MLGALTCLLLVPFAPQETAGLAARLDRILDRPALRGAMAGIVVTTAEGRELYARHPDLRMVPASNQKLLSVSFALHSLGPDWRPQTRFWNEPDRIVVDAPGDPSLTYEKLREAASKLDPARSKPVFVKQGFRAGVPPSWEHDDLPHRYAPRITAFTVNRGSFSLASRSGGLVLTPEAFGVRILHTPGGALRTEFDPFTGVMIVRGDVPQQDRNLENFAIPEPDRAAASLLGARLFVAHTLPGRAPDLVIAGDPVSLLAQQCLQPSDNYLGEALMMLAAMQEGPVGDNPYGLAPARMRGFLTKTVGLEEWEVRPTDGSGMSRHNFITPRGLAKLLRWALKQPTADLWKDALAGPGRAGTLQSRLKESSFVGKTGSLSAVSALSGYVRGPDGQTLVVVTFLNHFLIPAPEARAIADEIVREVEKPVVASVASGGFGAFLEAKRVYEGRSPLPQHSPSDWHRVFRSGAHRVAALAGTDR
jgi:serine-type D-Ala-D-Ala carboxypeptidase/endopeptidase (penicillin-binding protein 4)